MEFDPDVVRLFAQLQQAGQPPMEALRLRGFKSRFRGGQT